MNISLRAIYEKLGEDGYFILVSPTKDIESNKIAVADSLDDIRKILNGKTYDDIEADQNVNMEENDELNNAFSYALSHVENIMNTARMMGRADDWCRNT